MAYDEDLAARLAEALRDEPGVTSKRMFGGLAFLADGSLAVCASGQGGVMVRVDRAASAELVASGAAHPVETRGTPMAGWVRFDAEAVNDDAELRRWVATGLAVARSQPPKRRR